jgi:Lamin Tail Domain
MKNLLQICRFSILKSITAKFFLTFAALIVTQQMFAQFTDDFSDGDFMENPTWVGTDSKFVIHSQELKLQAPALTDMAYLTTAYNSRVQGGSWEFLVKLEFNPSSTNYTRIYLVSDQSDLFGLLNGYFVLLGNTSDDVSLWKQTGSSVTRIIDGADGRVDQSMLTVRIKVTCDESGMWSLFSDLSATGNYFNEGSAVDTTHDTCEYFGVLCSYTSTRADKFYFDDFIASSSLSSDTTPPDLKSIEVVSSAELRLIFSEILDKETAESIEHYVLDNNVGIPSRAILEADKKSVLLSFSHDFTNGVSYSISISGIKDNAGNIIKAIQKSFVFIQSVAANYKDIIFTEIFADPSPSVRLPEIEFVELHNRSNSPFDLSGWQITDGTSIMVLQHVTILPGEYLIATSSAAEFSAYGKTSASSDFPSLNNSGDMLLLLDSNGSTVDSVKYTDAWYKDDERKNGGWSLELIDPENTCSESENWIVSEDSDGGTPGKVNAVFSNKPDLTAPVLLSVIPQSSTLLEITFNEKLDRSLPLKSSFTIVPAIEITDISFKDATLTKLLLSLSQEIQPEGTYSITVTGISDCAGNSIHSDFNHVDFGLPQTANAGDIVINEILFNPWPMGVDFIEVVNVSAKFINLKNWNIANFEDDSQVNGKAITQSDFLFEPGAYLVLTEDVNVLGAHYPLLHMENVLIVDDLPAFNDTEGSAAIVNDAYHVIDSFLYSDDLHSIFINDAEGVSLERISFSRPTSEDQNWKSASSLIGFATPGYLNSNSKADVNLPDESVRIDPEIFNPVIGQPDFTQIHYKFDKGGYVASIQVYDDRGHLIKQIANNALLGTEGVLRWDGDRDDGQKARTGYYMVWFEVFDETGVVKTFRKRLAIVSRF